MSALLTRVPRPLRQLFWSVYGRSVWDAEHAGPMSPLVQHIADIVTRERGKSSARVLDAGCGTGVYARALAERGHHVTAIDTAPGMLLHARQRARTLPADCSGTLAVDTVSVDGTLPFSDASFDVALLVSVLQAVDRPARTLEELRRVLAPGGTLCVVHFPAHPNKALPLRSELTVRAKTLRSAGPVTRLWQLTLIALKSSAERHRITQQWTPDELLALVTRAGYAVRIEQLDHPTIIAGRTPTGARGSA